MHFHEGLKDKSYHEKIAGCRFHSGLLQIQIMHNVEVNSKFVQIAKYKVFLKLPKYLKLFSANQTFSELVSRVTCRENGLDSCNPIKT
jgi:hypothetical protein